MFERFFKADPNWTPVPSDLHGRFLDADGQPLNPNYNAWRRNDRATHELLGLIKGVLADGVVHPNEVISLCRWLLANAEPNSSWPVDVVWGRLGRIIHDGRLENEECKELTVLFEEIVGANPAAPPEHNTATRLPLTDPPPQLHIASRSFVFTGKFYYGTRKACESAVVERNGLCHPSVRKDTDVVVIGTLGSRDWLHTAFGNKIMKAVENIQAGANTVIVSEEHWAKHLQ